MKICPKCGKVFERLLTLSRTDNKTMICDACGQMEALMDFKNYIDRNGENVYNNETE